MRDWTQIAVGFAFTAGLGVKPFLAFTASEPTTSRSLGSLDHAPRLDAAVRSSAWGLKDAGQKRILAIDITREGFEWALAHSCLSHPDKAVSEKDWKALKNNARCVFNGIPRET